MGLLFFGVTPFFLGPPRVQVDRGGGAGCAGLPEIYRDSSIPRGKGGKYAIRIGRTVSIGADLIFSSIIC